METPSGTDGVMTQRLASGAFDALLRSALFEKVKASIP
jgi:hypothetical protein